MREEGSGTRGILEYELKGLGYDLKLFKKIAYISSFKLIRELVSCGAGISFVYESVIRHDSDRFGTFKIKDFNHMHEFNIVYLKNTGAGRYADKFFGKDK